MIPHKTMHSIRQKISRNIFNALGWRTKRKIVVIESDDWGSIRMPSKDVYEHCLTKGYRVDKNLYSRYDSLASEEDLDLLFNTLALYKDSNGRHPVITANCLVANPDFKRIRESDFSQYFFEPISNTFAKYPRHSNNLKIWKNASDQGLFFPQSHGREHLNVSRFMNDLKSGDQDARFAFDLNMPGIFKKDKVENGNDYVVAIEYCNESDKNNKIQIISQGLEIFKDLFKSSSDSFIACNYIWHPDFEQTLSTCGVKYIQGRKNQLIPKGNYEGFRKKFHYTGQKNLLGQIYLVRNVAFEPCSNNNLDWVNSCLKEIENAFRWNKPAIISMHQINFVGYIDPENRDSSLFLFNELLKRITEKWPMVEFLNSAELGSLISKTGKI